jgi:hypothetical protein
MQIITRALATIPVVLLALASVATAQEAPKKLQTGTWTGSVTPPGEETVAVTLEVKDTADALSITINAGGHGTFKADGITVEADRLVFSFTPGPVVVCALTRKEDASYEGDCTDDGGAAARMIIMPPKKEG